MNDYLVISEHHVDTSHVVECVNKSMLYKCSQTYKYIWVLGYSESEMREIVRWIRCSDMWTSAIIIGKTSNFKNMAIDGYADTWGDFIRIANSIKVSNPEKVDIEFRPLWYMASKNYDVIKPGYGNTNDRSIKYPILDSFGIYSQYMWFEKMLNEGYLKTNSSHAKCIYTCPSCYNDSFNFVEKCTNCSSHRLTHSTLIHCFVCGNISNESFVGVGEIHCPSCKEKWKHRGVDYEYILNAVECLDCNTKAQTVNTFIECTNCETHLKENELIKHMYGVYEFTRKVYDMCKIQYPINGNNIPVPRNKIATMEAFESRKEGYRKSNVEYIHYVIVIDEMYHGMVERKVITALNSNVVLFSDKDKMHMMIEGNRNEIQKSTEIISSLKNELNTIVTGTVIRVTDTHFNI